MMLPASQPASAPIARNIIKLVISMMPPDLFVQEKVEANNKTGRATNVESHDLVCG
jgi:hypothetical protein